MPDSTQVVRYGRNEMVQHEGTANGAVTAGYLVERTGGGAIAHHSTDGVRPAQVLVAHDARGRGMELGDDYADGDDAVEYLACSGGGVHLFLGAGVAATEGDDLVSAGDGTLRAFDGAGGDTEADVVAVAAEDIDNSGGTDPVPIATDVVN